MRFNTFIALAQRNPLAITEDTVEAIQKKVAAHDNAMLRLQNMIMGLGLAMPVLALGALFLFRPFNTHAFLLYAAVTLLVLLVLLVILASLQHQIARRKEALAWTRSLSEMQGDECTEVLHLCHASAGAREFRDRVLRDGRPLRMMHLEQMRQIVQQEKEARNAQERSRACRAAHGLVFDTKDGVVVPSVMNGIPLVALGALALAALVAKR